MQHVMNQRLNKLSQELKQLRSHEEYPQKERECCENIINNYVLSIADPEGHGPMRYPDHFSESTALFKGLIDIDMPLIESDDIIDLPRGTYYNEVRPELNNILSYIQEFDGSVEGRLVSGSIDLTNKANHFGFWDRSKTSFTRSGLSQGTYDCVLPMESKDGVPQLPSFVTPTTATVNTHGFFYLPFRNIDTAAPISSPYSMILSGLNTGEDGAVIFSVLNNTGDVIISDNVEVLTGESFKLVLTPANTVSPRARFSWRLQVEVINTSMTFDADFTQMRVSVTYRPNDIMFEEFNLIDIQSLQDNVEKYRVTALSALSTFIGNPLTVSGKATSYLYKGGVPAQYKGLYDYETVAILTDSYAGKILDGTYTYWEPADTTDMSYISLSAVNPYKKPYIISSGQFNGEVADFTNQLKLRVNICIEFTTKSQIWTLSPSPVCPCLIAMAARVLSNEPNSMENGKHLARIKQFFRRTGGGAKKVANWIFTHRGELEAVGSALLPLIL